MKIRTFFRALLKSISSPEYYLDVLNAPFRFSIRFFLVGYLLLALLATFFYATLDVPKYQSLFKQNEKALEANYPKDLVVNWDGKDLNSNQTSPIQVQYPIGIPHEGLPTVLAYISPMANSAAEVTGQVKTASLFIVTKNTLYVSSNDGHFSDVALKETPGFEEPFTVNKTTITHYTAMAETIFNTTLHTFTFVYPFMYFFVIGGFRFLSLLFNAIFIYYVLRFLGKALPYKKVLQLCLHVSVVAALLEVLSSHLIPTVDVSMYGIGFWLYLIIILISLWNVKNVILMKRPTK